MTRSLRKKLLKKLGYNGVCTVVKTLVGLPRIFADVSKIFKVYLVSYIDTKTLVSRTDDTKTLVSRADTETWFQSQTTHIRTVFP